MGQQQREGSYYDDNDNDNEQEYDTRASYCCSAAVTAALEAYRNLTKSDNSTADKYRTNDFDKPKLGYYEDLGEQLVKRGWWSR